jgi:hypothetical protein
MSPSSGAASRIRPGPTDRAWRVAFGATLAYFAGPSALGHALADASLTFHVLVEHTLLLLAGALLGTACGGSRSSEAVRESIRRRAGPAFILAGGLLGLWHVPGALAWASATAYGHGLMHLSLVGVGALFAIAAPAAGAGLTLAAIGAWQALMALLALLLYTGVAVYPGYPVEASIAVGVWMLALMMPSLIVVLALPWLSIALGGVWRRIDGPRVGTLVLGAAIMVSAALAGGR